MPIFKQKDREKQQKLLEQSQDHSFLILKNILEQVLKLHLFMLSTVTDTSQPTISHIKILSSPVV